MAKTTTIIVTDDLDGSTGDVQTVRFALDGIDYEVDLNGTHRVDLEEALSPFLQAGRRLDTKAKKTPTVNAKLVRAWASEHGIPVSTRGRISTEVLAAYQAA